MEFICFMNILYRYGKILLEDMLVDKEINMQELIVLLIISKSEGILQSKLNNFVGLDKGNFSNFLKNLEKRELIYRRKSKEFHSQNLCYLTDFGKSLVPELEYTLKEWKKLLIKNIDDENLNSFDKTSLEISKNIFDGLGISWEI